jgi:hypothetical protein
MKAVARVRTTCGGARACGGIAIPSRDGHLSCSERSGQDAQRATARRLHAAPLLLHGPAAVTRMRKVG